MKVKVSNMIDLSRLLKTVDCMSVYICSQQMYGI